jgi:hypothetical protein
MCGYFPKRSIILVVFSVWEAAPQKWKIDGSGLDK